MGDPECQVILPRLKTDLVKIIINSVANKLKKTKIEWKKNKSMTGIIRMVNGTCPQSIVHHHQWITFYKYV